MGRAEPEERTLQAQLVDMSMAHWLSRIVYVAAELRLADHLLDGARSAEELAGPTATHSPSLYRLMRALVNLGLLTESCERQFRLTPLGAALRQDAPGSTRASVLVCASDWWSRAAGELLFSVQTGKSGFEKALGAPLFEWLARNPGFAALFSETMIGFHGSEPQAVAAAYEFTGLSTLVDVGGASGNMLATILEGNPSLRGILFDLPHVVQDAPALFQARGLSNRVTIESGSFFERVPAGGDAYLLSHIIHDWNDEQSISILSNCRQAMRPDNRLLIIELVLPPPGVSQPGEILDLIMLVDVAGQERSAEEYRVLLGKAGFGLTRILPTKSRVSIVEAVIA